MYNSHNIDYVISYIIIILYYYYYPFFIYLFMHSLQIRLDLMFYHSCIVIVGNSNEQIISMFPLCAPISTTMSAFHPHRSSLVLYLYTSWPTCCDDWLMALSANPGYDWDQPPGDPLSGSSRF